MAATQTEEKKGRKRSKKKATDVLVAWCIDRSGSMGWLRDDTIAGFNAFIEEQQSVPDGKCYLSLVLFNKYFDAPIVATDVLEVEPLNTSTYRPAGGTALYDAVGVTIAGVEAWLKNNPSFKGEVLINVWTDGQENSSTRWDLGALMAEIERKQNDDGWKFAFIGAGGSAWTEGKQFAQTMGYANTTQVANNAAGARMSYAAVGGQTTLLRSTGKYAGTNDLIEEVASSASVMDSYGVNSAEEALAGTSNTDSTGKTTKR